MTFKSNNELPERVQNRLPESAQDLFRDAYNKALERFADSKKLKYGDTREETCYKAAWDAVKEKYVQKSDKWVAISHEEKGER